MRVPNVFKLLGMFGLVILMTGILAGCADDDDDVDEEDVRPITATATGVVTLPEETLEETIIIEDGSMDPDSIEVIAEQPVMLTVANRDDDDYTFLVEELITETDVPGAAETLINFNAPNSGEFEGSLIGPDGEEVTTFFINVTGPGGT